MQIIHLAHKCSFVIDNEELVRATIIQDRPVHNQTVSVSNQTSRWSWWRCWSAKCGCASGGKVRQRGWGCLKGTPTFGSMRTTMDQLDGTGSGNGDLIQCWLNGWTDRRIDWWSKALHFNQFAPSISCVTAVEFDWIDATGKTRIDRFIRSLDSIGLDRHLHSLYRYGHKKVSKCMNTHTGKE